MMTLMTTKVLIRANLLSFQFVSRRRLYSPAAVQLQENRHPVGRMVDEEKESGVRHVDTDQMRMPTVD